jgi:hypothetical protein
MFQYEVLKAAEQSERELIARLRTPRRRFCRRPGCAARILTKLINSKRLKERMSNQQPAPVNPAAEREYLMHALRTAAARSRLVTNVLDTVGVSLRHKKVTTDEAMKWLADEGVLDHVQIGPPGVAS